MKQKNIVIAYILWLIAGGEGLHRYYLGPRKIALLQSLLMLVSVAVFILVKHHYPVVATTAYAWMFFIPVGVWKAIDFFKIPKLVKASA